MLLSDTRWYLVIQADVQRTTCSSPGIRARLMESRYDIRTVQGLSGQKDVRTTMICALAFNCSAEGARNPVDFAVGRLIQSGYQPRNPDAGSMAPTDAVSRWEHEEPNRWRSTDADLLVAPAGPDLRSVVSLGELHK